MTTSTCTAPVNGHVPGSKEARECPSCNPSRRSAAPPALSSVPQSGLMDREPPSTMTIPSDEWDRMVHHAGTGLGFDDLLLDSAGFEFAEETIEEHDGIAQQMSRQKFYQAADDGRRVFSQVTFTDPMGEAETRGQVFSNCKFLSDVVLGDRTAIAECSIVGSLSDSSVTERGGRVSAIVAGSMVRGDVKLSGTSHVAMTTVEVDGNMTLLGGNGLQALFISDCNVEGVIRMDDSEAIVMSGGEHQNVIGFEGSAKSLLDHDNGGGATYYGPKPDDGEEGYAQKPVYFFSYDDLSEADQSPGQIDIDGGQIYDFDRFADMDKRVATGARALHKQMLRDREADYGR